MHKYSNLTFKDLIETRFGLFNKIVWNGKAIYEDKDDGVYINGTLVCDVEVESNKLLADYNDKLIYSFYCKIVDIHHTELSIEGE